MLNKLLSKIWLSLPTIFDQAQVIFNGNLWEVIQRKFEQHTTGDIIDLACGTGEFRKYIHPKSYIGIDINPAYIAHAKKRFNIPQTKFIVGDATKLVLPMRYNCAFFISAAHHLSDEQLHNLFKRLSKCRIEKIIIIDDIPVGPLSKPLTFLDDILGGGKYFRNEEKLSQIAGKYFRILETGKFKAYRSFYEYPYLITQGS